MLFDILGTMKKRKIKLSRVLLLCMPIIVALFFLRNCESTSPAISEPTSTPFVYIDPVNPNPYDFDKLKKNGQFLSYEDENYRSSFGVDVSFHQDDIDWNAFKDAGVEFAMIRAGYRGYQTGYLNTDTRFHNRIKTAIAAGIPVGVYFFTQAINEEEAIEEARYVLKLVEEYPLDLPIALDMEFAHEEDRIHDLSPRERTDIALAFVREIKNAGYEAMVYSSASWLKDELYMEELQEECSVWVASFDTKEWPYEYDFSIWQYSCTGELNGVDVPIDLNIRMIPKQ